MSSEEREVVVSIPDVGSPGTATEAQVEAVAKLLRTAGDLELSQEQAHLLLSARNYARAVATTLERSGRRVSRDDVVVMVAAMMANKETYEYAAEWSQRRFQRGADDDVVRLKRNEHFWLVVEAVTGQRRL